MDPLHINPPGNEAGSGQLHGLDHHYRQNDIIHPNSVSYSPVSHIDSKDDDGIDGEDVGLLADVLAEAMGDCSMTDLLTTANSNHENLAFLLNSENDTDNQENRLVRVLPYMFSSGTHSNAGLLPTSNEEEDCCFGSNSKVHPSIPDYLKEVSQGCFETIFVPDTTTYLPTLMLLVGSGGFSKAIPIHRAILCHYSPLARMHCEDHPESTTMSLPDWSEDVIKLMVEMMYLEHVALHSKREVDLIRGVMKDLGISLNKNSFTFVDAPIIVRHEQDPDDIHLEDESIDSDLIVPTTTPMPPASKDYSGTVESAIQRLTTDEEEVGGNPKHSTVEVGAPTGITKSTLSFTRVLRRPFTNSRNLQNAETKARSVNKRGKLEGPQKRKLGEVEQEDDLMNHEKKRSKAEKGDDDVIYLPYLGEESHVIRDGDFKHLVASGQVSLSKLLNANNIGSDKQSPELTPPPLKLLGLDESSTEELSSQLPKIHKDMSMPILHKELIIPDAVAKTEATLPTQTVDAPKQKSAYERTGKKSGPLPTLIIPDQDKTEKSDEVTPRQKPAPPKSPDINPLPSPAWNTAGAAKDKKLLWKVFGKDVNKTIDASSCPSTTTDEPQPSTSASLRQELERNRLIREQSHRIANANNRARIRRLTPIGEHDFVVASRKKAIHEDIGSHKVHYVEDYRDGESLTEACTKFFAGKPQLLQNKSVEQPQERPSISIPTRELGGNLSNALSNWSQGPVIQPAPASTFTNIASPPRDSVSGRVRPQEIRRGIGRGSRRGAPRRGIDRARGEINNEVSTRTLRVRPPPGRQPETADSDSENDDSEESTRQPSVSRCNERGRGKAGKR